MVRFVLDPNNPPRLTPEQEARQAAMTEEEIEAAALADPDNPPLTEDEIECGIFSRRIRLLRERLGLSQADFAERFWLPIGSVRDWEQGRRTPDAAAKAYITVIERDAEAVTRALEHA
jgi:putative transcriptional regulator